MYHGARGQVCIVHKASRLSGVDGGIVPLELTESEGGRAGLIAFFHFYFLFISPGRLHNVYYQIKHGTGILVAPSTGML